MIGQMIRVVSITVFLSFVLSCSLKSPEIKIDSSPSTEIQEIRVVETDGKMVIEVEGEEPMIYTTFHLADPDRLVIDMAGVSLGRFSDEIHREKGPIRSIRPATGGGDNVARLEFLLADSVETDVRTEGFNLVVEAVQSGKIKNGFKFFEDETVELPAEEVAEGPLGEEGVEQPLDDVALPSIEETPGTFPEEEAGLPMEEAADASLGETGTPKLSAEGVEPPPLVPLPPLVGLPDPMEPDPSLDEVFEEEVEEEDTVTAQEKATQEEKEEGVAIEQEESLSIVEKGPLSAAKSVEGVEFVQEEELQLLVIADGKLSPNVFFVDDKRLVIDLPGVASALKQSKILVDNDRVKQVRIGSHPEKLRLVVDLVSPIAYSWEQDRGILKVMLKDPVAQIAPSEIPVENQLEEIASEPDLPIPEDSEPTAPLPDPFTADVDAQDEVMQAEEMLALSPSEDESLPPQPSPPAVSEADGHDEAVKDEGMTVEKIGAPPSAGEEALPTPAPLSAPGDVIDQGDEMEVEQRKAEEDEAMKLEKAEVLPSPEEEALLALPPSLPTPVPLVTQPEAAILEETEAVEKVKEEVEKPDKRRTFLKNLREKKAKEDSKISVSEKDRPEKTVSNEDRSKYIGTKISLDFHAADITNVIRLIADVSGLNFVMGDDVKGKVTLKLSNVPWDQGLAIILEMNSLGQVREGNIIRITTLANLAKQRAEEAAAKETKIKAEDLLTRIVYVNYAKAGDMKALLDKLLSSRGEIMVDTRTNAFIIKDIESNLDGIEELAKRLDTKTPQVLIEARIAEVKPSFLESLGIQWGADFKSTNNGNIIGIGNADITSPVNVPVPDFAVNLPSSTNFGGIGFTFGRFTQNPFALDLRLSAGETQSLTRVVSTPKVMVLDNHEALIEQGQSVPFSTVSQDGTQIQFIDANLTLKVTPHISPDGGVLLDVHLSKNEPGIPLPGADNPPIFKKEVTTNVLLMNGETMVIGGIYETTKIESESGLPWFKDLPVLGWLFKNKSSREDTTELLVFLTPKIMD